MNFALPNNAKFHKVIIACSMLLLITLLMFLFPAKSSAHGI